MFIVKRRIKIIVDAGAFLQLKLQLSSHAYGNFQLSMEVESQTSQANTQCGEESHKTSMYIDDSIVLLANSDHVFLELNQALLNSITRLFLWKLVMERMLF
jgi:hypothetical protein